MKVEDCDDLVIITKDGMIIRQKVENIKTISRNTQGVRLINLKENDKVHDITRIQPEPDDETIEKETERLTQATEIVNEWEQDAVSVEEELDTDIEVQAEEDID
jgi:DNA gyrase subunit A